MSWFFYSATIAYYMNLKAKMDLLDLSAITNSRLCSIEATKRKIEHIPNITVIGNALTFKYRRKTTFSEAERKEKEKKI